MALDKIKRSFIWLRDSLEIIDRTTLPGTILGEVRPVLDTFGWDRLVEPEFVSQFAAAPANGVAGPVTPQGVVRVILTASVRHTDTGVDHFLWIEKLQTDITLITHITPPTIAVPVDVPQSLTRWIWCEPGTRLRGRSDINLVAGAIAFSFTFLDLPFGEYIPH